MHVVSSAADAQIQSMADKMQVIVKDLRSIVEQAKVQRQTGRKHTTLILRKADKLSRSLADSDEDDETVKACRAGVELQRELAVALGSRVFQELRRQGRALIELRQRLTSDDERIMEQNQGLKRSQIEVTQMGELLKKTQIQEK